MTVQHLTTEIQSEIFIAHVSFSVSNNCHRGTKLSLTTKNKTSEIGWKSKWYVTLSKVFIGTKLLNTDRKEGELIAEEFSVSLS